MPKEINCLRCAVCDITTDVKLSATHTTLTQFANPREAASYLATLRFWKQPNGDVYCDECNTHITNTLNSMEEERSEDGLL